jgi:hypothetical protein
VQVEYSLRDLLTLQALVDGERQLLLNEGIRISAIGIDPAQSSLSYQSRHSTPRSSNNYGAGLEKGWWCDRET